MKVLHTIETSGPGGAEQVFLQLVNRLRPADVDPLIVLNADGWLARQLKENGLRVEIVEWDAWYDTRLLRALVSIVRRERISLIHSHLPDQNFYAALAGGMTRCPVIATFHGQVELDRARSLKGKVKLRGTCRVSSRVVGVCKSVSFALRSAGCAERKLRTIYNGVEIPASVSVAAEVRRQMNWGADDFVVGTIANIRPPKGHEYLIRAARRVIDSYPHARFVVAGDLNSELTPGLKSLVEQLRLTDRFHFLGYRADASRLLQAFDAFVLPSTSEGMPLALMEAMANGTPAVATRCGGPEDMMVDEQHGFLVPTRDAEAMASRILRLAKDRPLAALMGRSAQRHAQQHFSSDAMIAAYAELYREVMAEKAGRASARGELG